MKKFIALALTLLSASAFSDDACSDDTCRSLMPPSLVIAAAKAFKGFRPPLATDNSADDIEWFVKQGGSGCFGAASADFNGDGRKDFILGLTSDSGNSGMVAAAFATVSGWELEKLADESNESRLRLFVGVGEPGTYELTEALDGPGPDDTSPLKCPHAVAVFGAIEAWGVTYCYNNGEWRHVQTSD